MTSYRTSEGDMVDLICWRHYGRSDGTTEAVLETNPGLAAHGPILPAGLVIELPDLSTSQIAPTISLWD